MEKLLLVVFGPLGIAAALFVVVMGVRQLVARVRSRLTPEQVEAKRGVYRSRLLNPQADAVERELGKLLPERLLRLYEDRSGIQSGGFEVENSNSGKAERWPVYCFEPLDVEALNDAPYEEELGAGFCFATTGRAGWYWIAACEKRQEDSPVIFLDYDGSGRYGEKVAESLDEFLAWPRTAMT
jgi:SMI1 / KNR4 family (SUKH-1)